MKIDAVPADGLPAQAGSLDREAQLRESARQFEAMFVELLVTRMRDAQLEGGFFGESTGSSIYEGMFSRHLAEQIVERSPLGIAEMLEREWIGDPAGAALAEEAMGRIREFRAHEAYGAGSLKFKGDLPMITDEVPKP